ncbi:MAG: hypothetical protein RJB08_863 [Actinomycetota bacterium]
MRRRHGQRFDPSAVTALIPVFAILPAWFVATSLTFLTVDVFFNPRYPIFMTIAALGCVVMFLPFTQRLFVMRLLGVRPPLPSESQRLAPAVRIVAAAARTPNRRFVLAIDASDDLNAFACGGHILVVSSFAVQELSDDELTGVVAHEFSHHLGAHTIGLSIAQWFSLPVIVYARLGFFLKSLAEKQRAVGKARLQHDANLVAYFLNALSAALTGFAWVFQTSLFTAQRVNNFVGRDAEFQADRRVVNLGFGRELSRALGRIASRDETSVNRTWQERLFSSHPPARTRIARIEAMLRSRRR